MTKARKLLVLGLWPLLSAATCPPDPPDGVEDPNAADFEVDVRCGPFRVDGVTISREQIEDRIRDVADALGYDFGGKTLIVNAGPLDSAVAMAQLDLDALDDSDRAAIKLNSNMLATIFSDPNLTNLILAHELNHLTQFFDSSSPLRAAQARLNEAQKKLAAAGNDPNSIPRQRAYIEVIEAQIPQVELLIAEERRVYGNVRSDQTALQSSGLLEGSSEDAVAQIEEADKDQAGSTDADGNRRDDGYLHGLKDYLEKELEVQREKLRNMLEGLPPKEEPDDEQASLDVHRLHVPSTAIAGDGGCGFESANFTAVQGLATLSTGNPREDVRIPLLETDFGVTNPTAVQGEQGVICTAEFVYDSVQAPAIECLGSSPDACGGSTVVGFGGAMDASCLLVGRASLAEALLTCFSDASLSEVTCQERFGGGEGTPTDEPGTDDDPPDDEPPTSSAVTCRPDNAEMSGDSVPQAGVEIDIPNQSCSAVSGFPPNDQLVIDDFGGTFAASGSGLTVLDVVGGTFENLDGFFFVDDLPAGEPISIEFEDADGTVFVVELAIEQEAAGALAKIRDVVVSF